MKPSVRRPAVELVAVGAGAVAWVLARPLVWLRGALLVAFAVSWTAYFGWRAWKDKAVLGDWGLTRPGLGWRPYVLVTAAGLALVAAWAWWHPVALPRLAWWSLPLYAIWALVQQFVLQDILAANLRRLGVPAAAIPLGAGLLLGAGHLPHLAMGALAAMGGVAWTAMWPRGPNLYAVGASHAVLGSAALIFVLGDDPAGDLLELIGRS